MASGCLSVSWQPVVVPDLEAVRHVLREPSGGTSWDGYRLRAALLWWKIARFRLQLPLAAVNPQKESARMAREGCWEALLSVLKLEDLLSPSWRKFEISFESSEDCQKRKAGERGRRRSKPVELRSRNWLRDSVEPKQETQ